MNSIEEYIEKIFRENCECISFLKNPDFLQKLYCIEQDLKGSNLAINDWYNLFVKICETYNIELKDVLALDKGIIKNQIFFQIINVCVIKNNVVEKDFNFSFLSNYNDKFERAAENKFKELCEKFIRPEYHYEDDELENWINNNYVNLNELDFYKSNITISITYSKVND